MKAQPRCIPCFLDQAVEALELCGADQEIQTRTMKRLLQYVRDADLELSPPEISHNIHRIIREETGDPDPYLSVKQLSTDTVMDLLPRLNRLMEDSTDPLSLAVKIGALGNVIDFGTPIRIDINKKIDEVLGKELTVFDIEEFREALMGVGTILFLGDNAGEIILDTFLLEQLRDHGDRASGIRPEIVYGVREGPIINDATTKEAHEAGIEKYARLITTGSQAPGTLLSQATPDLKDALASADLIISKGQGNYESLSSDPLLAELVRKDVPVFFLLTVKCGIVGTCAGVPEGSTIFREYVPRKG
jgi:damage-control phosphatase, subfamily I